MGTHPIFESDFDCLTEYNKICHQQNLKQLLKKLKHFQKNHPMKKNLKFMLFLSKQLLVTVILPVLECLILLVKPNGTLGMQKKEWLQLMPKPPTLKMLLN